MFAFEGSPEFIVDAPPSVTVDHQPGNISFPPGFHRALSLGLAAAALAGIGSVAPTTLRRIDLQNARSTSPYRTITAMELGFLPDAPLAAALSRLLTLGNGWADGEGIAPQLPALIEAQAFARALGHHLAEQLVVAPTLEGGVVLERQVGPSRWSLDIDADGEPFVILVSGGTTDTAEPADAQESAQSFRAFVGGLAAAAA